MVRVTASLVGFLLVTAGAAEVTALEVRFGYSGLHTLDADTFDAMDEVQKRSFLEGRRDLAGTLGADALRTGAGSPHYLVIDDDPDWPVLDHRVGALSPEGIEVALTLADVPSGSDASAYKARFAAILERYDGDLDFGVEPIDLNTAYPDINGSGSITNDDWEASDALKSAWAESHRLTMVEIGERVRSLEERTSLSQDAYGEHLADMLDLLASADEP